MKVVCITDRPMFDPPQCSWILKIGKVYEVVSERNYHGFDYYELAEQPGVGYCVENFAPISDIDETEMIREYKKEIV